jgi:hypothetical protein
LVATVNKRKLTTAETGDLDVLFMEPGHLRLDHLRLDTLHRAVACDIYTDNFGLMQEGFR